MKISKIQTVVVGFPDSICRFRLNQLALTAGQTKPVLGARVTGTADDHASPRGAGIGFILESGGVRIYHAGGAAAAPELEGLETDIALLPVGPDTMSPRDAAALARRLKARAALPMDFAPDASPRAEEFVAAARAEGLESFVPKRTALSSR